MSQNVWEQFGSKSATLQAKLEGNTDLANTIMAILGNVIVLAHEKNVPFEGVMFAPITEDDGVFKSRMTFHALNVGTVAQLPARADFLDYTRARSAGMARALERSPRLQKFFEELVEAVDHYSLAKGIPFEALKIYKRFVTPDNVLVFKVGRDSHGE